jgi:hypothetical protein
MKQKQIIKPRAVANGNGQRKPGFKVGDRVVFRLVESLVHGTITEDRGALAGDGQHIYRVRAEYGPDEFMFGEFPEDNLKSETEAVSCC